MNDSKETIRVLHVVTQMNRNGLESRIMDIYRNIDRNKIQFDFSTHRMTEGVFEKEILQLGGRVYHLPAIQPHKLLQYKHNLHLFFLNHPEYRIVHAHLNAYSTVVLTEAKKAGIPVRIAHSRNSGMDFNFKAVFKYVSKWFINIPTTHKFACSKQAGRWLFGQKGIEPPNYFRVIPNGFDIEKFKFSEQVRVEKRKELGLSNELAVVHIGRLTPQKNHEFLLNVFRMILKRTSAKLFLFGDGELKEKLQNIVENDSLLNGKVFFMGNRSDVNEYLNAMDIMIFPSVYEGFGTVVLETQCNGIPTLASSELSEETRVTECIEYLPLSQSFDVWADKAISMFSSFERKDRKDEIKSAGYDIEDTYKIMSEFYLKCGEYMR